MINWSHLGPFDSNGDNNQSNACSNFDNPRRQNQGRVDGINIHPNNLNEILIGGANGGVWLSEDAGQTWVNTTKEEGFNIVGVYKILRHPENPNVVYASTHSWLNIWNRQRSYGIGLIVSSDGGRNWEQTGSFKANGLWAHKTGSYTFAIDPRSSLSGNTIVYVGLQCSVIKFEGTDHLLKDENSWTNIDLPSPRHKCNINENSTTNGDLGVFKGRDNWIY